MMRRTLTLLAITIALGVGLAYSEGLELNKGTISWSANTESDLKGYRLYTRKTSDPTAPRELTAEIPKGVTSINTIDADVPEGQNYLSMTAVDTSGNESVKESPLIPFVQLPAGKPYNFQVTNITGVTARLTFEQSDGNAEIRVWPEPGGWGSSSEVPCVNKVCDLIGLKPNTRYQYQGVGYSGERNTSTVVYTTLTEVGDFTTSTVIVTPPPMPPPPIPPPPTSVFRDVKTTATILQFTYDTKDCPRGILRSTFGKDTKTIMMTCMK